MLDIRHFEEKVFDLLGQNKIRDPSHLYTGQEAVAVGAISTLRPDDWISSTYRGHGHCYARGAFLAQSEEERQQHLNAMFAELCGRVTGYGRGRGGPSTPHSPRRWGQMVVRRRQPGRIPGQAACGMSDAPNGCRHVRNPQLLLLRLSKAT